MGLNHVHRYIAPRMALVAEAAHAMHPIAGQGLNMGMRDILCLAEFTGSARENNQDIGDSALLETYSAAAEPIIQA